MVLFLNRNTIFFFNVFKQLSWIYITINPFLVTNSNVSDISIDY